MEMSSSPNYYDLLGVTIDSTEKEILTAYRKKALTCHPDKNPDNPKAAELFIEIAEAFKVLTDTQARAAFDKVLKAKEAARLRTQAFDAKRKKFKEDLDERENASYQQRDNDISNAEKLAAEIKRLREEGSRLLNEQQQLIQRQLDEERKRKIEEAVTPKLKVKWKASKKDHQNGGYNEEILMNMFAKYGPVCTILISARKNGLAIVEYENCSHAKIALEFEKGFNENPLTVIWLDGSKQTTHLQEEPVVGSPVRLSPTSTSQQNTNVHNDHDFESVVLMRMRQAEERKRLTHHIMEEDEKESGDESAKT